MDTTNSKLVAIGSISMTGVTKERMDSLIRRVVEHAGRAATWRASEDRAIIFSHPEDADTIKTAIKFIVVPGLAKNHAPAPSRTAPELPSSRHQRDVLLSAIPVGIKLTAATLALISVLLFVAYLFAASVIPPRVVATRRATNNPKNIISPGIGKLGLYDYDYYGWLRDYVHEVMNDRDPSYTKSFEKKHGSVGTIPGAERGIYVSQKFDDDFDDGLKDAALIDLVNPPEGMRSQYYCEKASCLPKGERLAAGTVFIFRGYQYYRLSGNSIAITVPHIDLVGKPEVAACVHRECTAKGLEFDVVRRHFGIDFMPIAAKTCPHCGTQNILKRDRIGTIVACKICDDPFTFDKGDHD